MSLLMGLNFSILFSMPWECVKLGLMVTPLVFIYPTTKRYFAYPQLVLGLTFNSGVAIGYACLAASNTVAWAAVTPFYLGGVLWTIIYDSIYAFQDRTFDKGLGLRSTAIEMEHAPKQILSALAATSVGCFAAGGLAAGLSAPYFVGLTGVAAHYAWQISTLNIEDRQSCWDRFQSNRWLGLLLFGSILAGRTFSPQKEDE